MLSNKFKIVNPKALGSREGAALVAESKKFTSKISMRHAGTVVDTKSIMNIMYLDLKEGEEIEINTFGDDENAAMDAVVSNLKNIKLV
jgi:phosphocarrier protein HPr